jgi:hypothetical protein
MFCLTVVRGRTMHTTPERKEEGTRGDTSTKNSSQKRKRGSEGSENSQEWYKDELTVST